MKILKSYKEKSEITSFDLSYILVKDHQLSISLLTNFKMSENSNLTGINCDVQGNNEDRPPKRPRVSFEQGVINVLEEDIRNVKQERNRAYEYGSFLAKEKILREIEDKDLRTREQLRGKRRKEIERMKWLGRKKESLIRKKLEY